MNRLMAFYTDRNNVEPMFWSVTLMMMIFFCLVITVMALQGVWSDQFSACYGIMHDISGFVLFWVAKIISFTANLTFFAFLLVFFYNFTFFALRITSAGCLTFIALAVLLAFDFSFFASFITKQSCSAAGLAFFCLAILFMATLTLFTSPIPLQYNLSFLAFLIFLDYFKVAYLAIRTIAIFSMAVFVKFREGFNLFANSTSFAYDLLRHNLLQYSKLSFRAGQGLQSLFGSLYYISYEKNVKPFLQFPKESHYV